MPEKSFPRSSRNYATILAFELYVTRNISFADAYNATYMQAEHIASLYSWDTDFDKIEGIVRLEPEEANSP